MHSIWQTKNHPATYRVHFLFDKLGLGFHGCAHLSRVDNRVLFSRPCLGGYHWLRTKQLLRWHPVVDLTRDTSRAPTRPRRRTGRLQAGTRQIEVPRLGLHNACAEWLLPVLLRSAAEQAPFIPACCSQSLEGSDDPTAWAHRDSHTLVCLREAVARSRLPRLRPPLTRRQQSFI